MDPNNGFFGRFNSTTLALFESFRLTNVQSIQRLAILNAEAWETREYKVIAAGLKDWTNYPDLLVEMLATIIWDEMQTEKTFPTLDIR